MTEMKYSIKELGKILAKAKEKKEKVALCHGCFDGLHEGHLELFKKAREIADIVVVGIESDDYIRRAKSDRKPFYGLQDRVEAVAKTGLADYIFVIPLGNCRIYKKIYMDLKSDYLVTAADEVYRKKEKDAIEVKIRIVIVEKTHHSRDKSIRRGLFGK